MPVATITDLTMQYTLTGPAEGLPVILLHAFPLSGAMWAAQATALGEEAGCRVVVPDLRGFGGTSAPAGPYPMDLLARDVVALADQLGLERFVLGGLSMGGYVAFALLRLAPQRVRGLILADTRAGTDTPEGQANREVMAQLAEREGTAPIADIMLPRLLAPASLANPAILDPVRAMILANSSTGIAGAARGMAQRADASDLLADIACPTLVLVGDQDTTTPITEAQILFERIPNAALVTLPNVGHLSNLEAPEAFTAALIHFVAGL